MATLNLGRIKPVFKGAWTSGAFVIDDIVTHGNECFICIQAGTNKATSDASYWTKLAAKGTDGTDVGTTITTQGDILFRDGSGLQRLAKGTAAQTLQMNAGATAPEWVSASSGGLVKLASISSSSGEVSIDGHYTSDYNMYKIYLWDITHSGTNWGKIWVNQGGSKDTSSNYRQAGNQANVESGSSGSGNFDKWNETYGILHYWGSPSRAEVTIYDPLGSNHKVIQIRALSHNNASKLYNETSTILHANATASTGITFGSTATLGNCYGALFGIKTS